MLKFSKKSGFTLIETVLAMIVLAIGIFGTMHLFYQTADRAFDTDIAIRATSLARDRLEQVIFGKKMNGYASVNATNYPPTESLTGNYSGLTRTTSILEVNPTNLVSAQNGSEYKRVTVTVAWNGGSITLDTLVTLWGEVQ